MAFCEKLGSGKSMDFDLPVLIESRLLIQANSGGGKSYAIRKLLEETHGKVQQIVLDIEGEFGTLREKYDFILVGKNGDVPVSSKTAELLARKLLELGTSAIIDLYELKAYERTHFVKLFLDALVNAPKELWHPALVVVDEAHYFCPQVGESEAMSSVIDLATRGRKRGYCAVLATQRLSKLHKDAAAECNNKLIGRSGLDVDMKRAAEELGFTTREERLSLRNLQKGVFYAFGPAISQEVTLVKVNEVSTTHPKVGQRLGVMTVPAKGAVLKALEKFKDLPKEAEAEVLDRDTLRKRVRELEHQVRSSGVKPDEKVIAAARVQGEREASQKANQGIRLLEDESRKLRMALSGLSKRLAQVHQLSNVDSEAVIPVQKVSQVIVSRSLPKAVAYSASPVPVSQMEDSVVFGRCERAILKWLALREGTAFSKQQIGVMTGYSSGSGGFNNSMSRVKTAGLVVQSGDRFQLAPGALSQVQSLLGSDFAESSTDNLERWLGKLGKCPKEIYGKLLSEPDRVFTKEDLGNETGYSAGSGGFNNSISELCTLGLAERADGGIRLNKEVQGL